MASPITLGLRSCYESHATTEIREAPQFNDGDYRGIEAIRGAFERTWAHNVKEERYYLTHVEVVSVDADSAVAAFQFHWSGVGQQGPFHLVGRGTSVIVRHQGELKILVEHLSR